MGIDMHGKTALFNSLVWFIYWLDFLIDELGNLSWLMDYKTQLLCQEGQTGHLEQQEFSLLTSWPCWSSEFNYDIIKNKLYLMLINLFKRPARWLFVSEWHRITIISAVRYSSLNTIPWYKVAIVCVRRQEVEAFRSYSLVPVRPVPLLLCFGGLSLPISLAVGVTH